MNKILTLSVAVALATFAGCKKETVSPENCMSKASGQFTTGKNRADGENAVDFSNGEKAGGDLGYDDGKKSGLTAAYNTGYNSSEGYPKGLKDGYPGGLARGKSDTRAAPAGVNDGSAKGGSDGRYDGDKVGSADGQTKGIRDGKADGYYDGYEDGYNAAYAVYGNNHELCGGVGAVIPAVVNRSIASDRVKVKDLPAACEMNGYNTTRNAQQSYNDGYAKAKAGNTDFNLGFNDFKNDRDTISRATVIGYNDGKAKGDENGWKDGYASVYNPAYAAAYKSAYNLAYGTSYNSSYKTTYLTYYKSYYKTNYDLGYDDGYDDGESDYCAGYVSLDVSGDALRVVQSSAGKASRPNYRKSSRFLKNSSIGYNLTKEIPKKAFIGGVSKSSDDASDNAEHADQISQERKFKGKELWNLKASSTGKWARRNSDVQGGAWFLKLGNDKVYQSHEPK